MTNPLQPEKEYNLSAKKPDNDKWWNFGSLKVNQFGNWSIGMKVTDELVKLVEAKKGQYINLSVFENDRKHQQELEQNSQSTDLGADIPY